MPTTPTQKLAKLVAKGTPQVSLSNAKLDVLPEGIAAAHVAKLDLRGNELVELSGIEAFSNLEELQLAKNPITALPDTIDQLSKLRVLDVEDTPITTLPASLAECTQLEKLWLGGAPIISLPSLPSLGKLVSLNLARTKLTALPEWIGSLASLEALYAGGPELTTVPDAIGALSNLKTLALEATSIRELPASIGELGRLKTLSIMGGKLARLPTSLGKLDALDSIRLYDQPDLDWATVIPSLPPNLDTLLLGGGDGKLIGAEIGALASLASLVAKECGLTGLPDAIAQCAKLGSVDLSGNPLGAVPPVLERCSALKTLALNRCAQIDWSAMPVLDGLVSLSLQHCGLTDIPPSLAAMTNLKLLYLDGNPIPKKAITAFRGKLPSCQVVQGRRKADD